MADAGRVLGDRKKAHKAAVDRLTALRKEKAAGDAELAAIQTEVTRLAELEAATSAA